MSRALMVRSIPLSTDTRDAWKEAGAWFARRDRTDSQIERIADGRTIINLGSSNLGLVTDNVWNKSDDIAPLLTPASSRVMFHELMPTDEWIGPDFYWAKTPGRGGNGKQRYYLNDRQAHNVIKRDTDWNEGDIQLELVGQEYRVITVEDKVVQVMKRSGTNGSRVYEWVGVSAAPDHIKKVARTASSRLNGRNIIGWDVVEWFGRAYIFEGNSCPGVNAATAGRILDAVEGLRYAA